MVKRAMSKVSIIIPTYNRANYVCQAIESALAQDYPDLEIVVSDNASADGTAEAVKSYGCDHRLKYFRNSENIGMVPNFRKALYDHAAGDWAIVLNDDDYFIDRSFISKAMKLAGKDGGIVLVHANCKMVNESTGFCSNTDKRLPEIVDGKWMFINYTAAMKGKTNYDTPTVVFDRNQALHVGFFNDAILSCDRESFLKLSLKGKVGFLNDVVAAYRIHSANSFSTADLTKIFDNMRANTSPYRYAKELKAFEDKELERWKKRVIREYAEIRLIEEMLKADKKLEFWRSFSTRLYREYPYALTASAKIFKPRIFAKLLASWVFYSSPKA
jgi:glycosyltransferase involved in cell wall biosynthesis